MLSLVWFLSLLLLYQVLEGAVVLILNGYTLLITFQYTFSVHGGVVSEPV